MSIKTHQSADGLWRRCIAKDGECPLGGSENHKVYANVQELAIANQVIIDAQGQDEHGLLAKMPKDGENVKKVEKIKPLKERTLDELRKKWTRRGYVDESMVKHSLKSYKYIDLDGSIVDIGRAKPTISSTIYFNDEYEAPQVNYENFASYNKRLNGPSEYKLQTSSYHGNGRLKLIKDEKSNIAQLSYDDPRDESLEVREVSEKELEAINQGIREINDNYEKRLKTYYKKYSDKIFTSGYWAYR